MKIQGAFGLYQAKYINSYDGFGGTSLMVKVSKRFSFLGIKFFWPVEYSYVDQKNYGKAALEDFRKAVKDYELSVTENDMTRELEKTVHKL